MYIILGLESKSRHLHTLGLGGRFETSGQVHVPRQ